jgi:hypothetical protein
MKMFRSINLKSLSVAVSALALSTSVNAALVSKDWKDTGDNLITRDTVSGLEWLDMTETNDMSYNFVSLQLDVGGQFEGWRYASSEEVIILWGNFGINLAGSGLGSSVGLNTGIITATDFFGDTSAEYYSLNTGSAGLVSNSPAAGEHIAMGAYYNQPTNTSYYYQDSIIFGDDTHYLYYGSYLVQTSPVPVPTAAWLFGSGLIGLIGVARRKA